MSQRTPSHCVGDRARASRSTAARRLGRERVQLHDVGPRREVRVATVREHAAADPTNEPGRARGRRRRPHEVLRVRAPSRGGRARRGSARSRARARRPRSASAARAAASAGRPAEVRRRRRSRGCSTASRRRPPREVRERLAEALDQAVVRERDRDPGGAALPDAHQPDGVEPERRDRVPFPRGHAREIGSVQRVKPHPCVDLVEKWIRRTETRAPQAIDSGTRANTHDRVIFPAHRRMRIVPDG